MNFESWLQKEHPEIPGRSAAAVLKLVGEEATVPFIARYRKEQTGNLDEVGIQNVIDSKERWDQLIKRQAFIVEEVERQKKLTPELKEKFLSTFDPDLLEEYYLPYKQKRKTKATLAKEAGLEPLADWIWNCGHGTETPQEGQTLEIWAFTFKNEEKGFKDAASAIEGAQDILIERISENTDLRQMVRANLFDHGFIRTEKGEKAKANSKYENYFSYNESVQSLLKPENSHRYLAIRRGWIEEELKMSLGGQPEDAAFEANLLNAFEGFACTVRDSVGNAVLVKAARMALKVHVLPSIENAVQKALKEVADKMAIEVFSANLRKLLMASPFGAKGVLGVDPGIRTGCKLAVVDDTGKFIANAVVYLQSDDEKEKSKILLKEVLKSPLIQAVAVGNGTHGRETELFVREIVKELNIGLPVVMVSEAGASVYSASEAAREEFPDLDVTVRGAISIARRLQDPLAELVKVDPKSIGVGQYQHDVSQPALKRTLDFVVDSCVNAVGVNLNTASYHLLAHVSGIGPMLAKSIVEHRGVKGLFKARTQLLEVDRFSKKVFEQAAGFLRIPGAENPLDNTGIHPERYELLENLAKREGKTVSDLMGDGVAAIKKDTQFRTEAGDFTADDIIRELEKPGRDPRETFVPFQYREDIHTLKDLQPGMICPGIVTNVTNFGAFVDIGIHQDGLVHISQLCDRFVKDPKEVVSPGDRVKIRVLEVNVEKNQISLSMKNVEEKPRPVIKPKAPGEQRQAQGRRDQRDQRDHRDQRDQRGKHPGPGKPGKREHEVRPRREKPAFNNPFASLAALKNTLKPR